MNKVGFVKEIEKWSGGDPFRDAILIKETPIAASTLLQLKQGLYIPSERMKRALQNVMDRHPKNEKSDPEVA